MTRSTSLGASGANAADAVRVAGASEPAREARSEKARPNDVHPQEGRPNDVHPQEGRPQERRPNDTHPQEGRPQEGHPQDAHSQEGRPQEASAREALPRPKKRRIWLRVLIAFFIVLVLAAGVLAGLFAWDRWWRYDDAADMQGTWYASGTTVPVNITASEIIFDSKTSYEYTLDTQAKTMRYTLASLEGEGRYWFDDDRQTLVIVDGKGFTSTDTALDDLRRRIDRLFGEGTLPEGEGVIVLKRELDFDALKAKVAAEEAAKRAAEEAERAAAEAEAAADSGASEEGAGGDASEPAVEGSTGQEAAERAPSEDGSARAGSAESASSGEAPKESSEEAGEPAEKQDFANESVGFLE